MTTTLKMVTVGIGQVGASSALGRASGGVEGVEQKFEIAMLDVNRANVDKMEKLVLKSGFQDTIHAFQVGGSTQEDYRPFAEQIGNADIVELALHADQATAVVAGIAHFLKPGAILTSTFSVHGQVSPAVTEALSAAGRTDVVYVPVHPGTGGAKSGPDGADKGMYKGQKIFFMHPTGEFPTGDNAEARAYKIVRQSWECQSAIPEAWTIEGNDLFWGYTSQFQHLLVFALALMGRDENGNCRDEYKNGGAWLCNTTRVAMGDTEDMIAMWTRLIKDNREVVVAAAEGFNRYMENIIDCIEKNDVEGLEKILEVAHTFRSGLAPKDAASGIFRENIYGELDMGLLMTAESKQNALVRRTFLPFLMGAASSANVQEALVVGAGMNVAGSAGPSFADGTAPALESPIDMAARLIANKDTIVPVVRELKDRVAEIASVANESVQDPTFYESFMRDLITSACRIRQQMPLPSRLAQDMPGKNRAVRPAYITLEPSGTTKTNVVGRGRGIERRDLK